MEQMIRPTDTTVKTNCVYGGAHTCTMLSRCCCMYRGSTQHPLSEIYGLALRVVSHYLLKCLNSTAAGYLSELYVPVASASGRQISGQLRRAYYKFPEPESRSAGGASLSRDHLCGTVFLLLYGEHFQATTEGLSVPHLMYW